MSSKPHDKGLTKDQLAAIADQLADHFARLSMKQREPQWRAFGARVWRQVSATDKGTR